MGTAESTMEARKRIALTVNGKGIAADVEPWTTLAEFLREELGLTGTKIGCNRGECGSCTVLLDGQAIYSCSVLAVETTGRDVVTIEGLMKDGQLHPLQEAFLEHDALQCGYCTPGMLMSLIALLDSKSRPSPEEISEAIGGNACRCGCFPNILKATLAASEKIAP